MNESTKILLAKLTKEPYVESFLDGNLFLNCATYFKKLENTDVVRADCDEGIDWAIQAKEVSIQGPDGEWIPIGGLIGPLMHYTDESAKFHMFCMYMFTDDEAEVFDYRNLDFGERFVFVFNPAEFFRRIQEALSKLDYTCKFGPVKYVDRNTYHGPMGPFAKFSEYAYQKEFRLVVRSEQNHINEPLIVQVGSLRDICWAGHTSEIAQIAADLRFKEKQSELG
jgi:hypothetical protein